MRHSATLPCSFDGALTLTGRLLTASNATFVGTVDTAAGPVEVVHKPIRGERELWDFPTGTLALREVAAYRISAAGGFDVVPYTALVDGPFGPGSTQRWVEADELIDDLVDIVAPAELADGWFPVLEGENTDGEAVLVAHAPDPRLRTIAVFDALVNNADRKAGHILRTPPPRPVHCWPATTVSACTSTTSCAPCCGAGPASRWSPRSAPWSRLPWPTRSGSPTCWPRRNWLPCTNGGRACWPMGCRCPRGAVLPSPGRCGDSFGLSTSRPLTLARSRDRSRGFGRCRTGSVG